jgi:hypothetical protein
MGTSRGAFTRSKYCCTGVAGESPGCALDWARNGTWAAAQYAVTTINAILAGACQWRRKVT